MGIQAGYAAWMAALIVAYIVLPSLRAQSWTLLYLSVMAAMLAGTFRNAPVRKAPWLLLVTASASFGLAQLSLLAGGSGGHPVTPGLSVEDLMSLAKSPLIAIALVLFARARSPGGDRQSLIDAFTVTVGVAMMIWIFSVLPTILNAGLTGDERLIMIGFPVGNVIVILALARLVAPGTTPRGSLLLISAGVTVGLVAGVVYGLIRAYGPDRVITILDVGWTACFALCGLAALRPDMRAVTQPTKRRVAEASRARLLLLMSTTLIAPALLTYLAFFDNHVREGDIAATATVLYLTVLARLWSLNLSHRRSLLREREARMAGVALASARTIKDVSAVAEHSVTAFIGRNSPHETLFAIRAGEELRVVSPSSDAGESPPEAGDTGIAQLAATWLPRLRPMTSADPRFAPIEGLDPEVRAAAERAGYDAMLVCPLTLADRLSGDPLVGLLAVLGKRRDLRNLKGSLGILASQVALAVERVTLTQELVRQRSEAVFRTLVQDTSDVILILDEEFKVRYATPSAASIYGDIAVEGTPVGSLTAQSERLAVSPALRQPGADGSGRTPGGEDLFSGLWRITRHDGRTLLVEVRYSDRRTDVTVGGHVLTVRDVTEQRQLEDELKHRVFHDALTGLPNRVLFADRAAHGVALARRNGTTAAVLFIDLDDFKIINDTMGHSVGDELLEAVARRLASVTRASDTAARLGGDEFALLIENLASPNAVEAFADRVVTAFTEPFQVSAGSVLTTVTVGVATSDDSSDADQLLRHADLALYAAKAAGKRRWHQYVPMLSAGMVRRREMQAALEEAVTKSAFELAYQPIVTLADGHISGLEALLRWPHPSWGMLMPGQFIDIAEETGHIIPLGAWVLRQAITDLARWRGPDPDPRQPFVSVNVAARQFRDAGFVANVRRLLDESGLVPSALMLELTESGLLHRDERINSDLAELKDAGVRLAIDDFGTGYSSLSYLRELPIDVLKIDKSFVDGIASSGQRLALARGIVEIARTLEIDVIAEGIETEEQRTLMTDMGCRYGQGYLLARPMTWEKAQVLLRSGQGLVPELRPRRAVIPGGYAPPRPRDYRP
jgi:diguanylate cyclase (GGDEF)-like protein/PAS domain S-box-containing protein